MFTQLLLKLYRSAGKFVRYKQYLYYACYFLLKSYLGNSRRKNESSGIMIVTRGGLGDLVYSFRFLQDLKLSGRYNRHYILLEDKYREILSSVSLNYEIILWENEKAGSNPFYFINLIKQIRELNISTAINITPSRGILTDAITLLSGCENTFCHSSTSIFYPEPIQKKMNSEYGTEILSSAINNYERLSDILGFLKIPDSSKSSRPYLINSIPHQTDPYVVVAPFSSDLKRTWGTDNYAELCRRLSKTIHIVLIGGSEHKSALQNIASEVDNAEVKAGSFSETDIINTIGKASLFIGNDSGPAHVAFYLNVPMVAIVGGGCYNEFFPRHESKFRKYKAHHLECFGCAWKCCFNERYCLTKIPNEDVTKDVLLMLGSAGNSAL